MGEVRFAKDFFSAKIIRFDEYTKKKMLRKCYKVKLAALSVVFFSCFADLGWSGLQVCMNKGSVTWWCLSLGVWVYVEKVLPHDSPPQIMFRCELIDPSQMFFGVN